MNNDIIKQPDLINIGIDLQTDKRYIEVASQLEIQGKKRIILDREGKNPYLIRYYYLNLRPFARLVIHQFMQSDPEGLHDHPWPFQNYILSGGYWEHTVEGKFWREPGYLGSVGADFLHRVELDPKKAGGEEIWTLFMMGPKVKSWGFLDEDGKWIQHNTYIENKRKEL